MKKTTTWWEVRKGVYDVGIYPYEVINVTATKVEVVLDGDSTHRIARETLSRKFFDNERGALLYLQEYLWGQIGRLDEQLQIHRDWRSRVRAQLDELPAKK